MLRKGRVQYNRWHVIPRIDLKVHTECAVDGYVVCTGAPAVRGIDGVSWTGSMLLIPLLNLCSIGLDHHIQHFYAADSHSFTHVHGLIERCNEFSMERVLEKAMQCWEILLSIVLQSNYFLCRKKQLKPA